VAAFPGAAGAGVIFAWGPDIYNPSGIVIPPALLAHEAVHGARQNEARWGAQRVEMWWDLYCTDPEFRYREELAAHAAEYRAQALLLLDRNVRARLLVSTATRLTAPLYNYSDKHSLSAAMRDLRREIGE
jgi:hypothetical protein